MSQDYGENLIVGGEYKKEKCMWRLSLCIVLIYFIWKQSAVNKRSFSVDLSHFLNLCGMQTMIVQWVEDETPNSHVPFKPLTEVSRKASKKESLIQLGNQNPKKVSTCK